MNEYINKLIQDDKLSLSVDKSKTFGFQLGDKWIGKDKVLISGPCSVESRDMIIDWSQELKEVGVDMVLYPLTAFRAMSQSAEKIYNSIIKDGTQEALLDIMQTREELYEVLDYYNFEKQLDDKLSKN